MMIMMMTMACTLAIASHLPLPHVPTGVAPPGMVLASSSLAHLHRPRQHLGCAGLEALRKSGASASLEEITRGSSTDYHRWPWYARSPHAGRYRRGSSVCCSSHAALVDGFLTYWYWSFCLAALPSVSNQTLPSLRQQSDESRSVRAPLRQRRALPALLSRCLLIHCLLCDHRICPDCGVDFARHSRLERSTLCCLCCLCASLLILCKRTALL